MTSEPEWWRSAVVYQIYPRSFRDTDGDGVGDLEGVRRGLDHLLRLGVDAIWLSPFYRSPMADFGYDVSDHCDVDPVFGTLADFDRLLAEAHARGLRVLVDWVPNHTSDRHPWFLASRSSRTDPKRGWYVWRDGPPDRPPNNWRAAFGGPAWTYDEPTGQWYLHLFLPAQPDLDWRNPEVATAMHGVLRFWLDRGVDGVRIDVAHCLAKEPELPDDPAEPGDVAHSAVNDCADTHAVLRDIRRLVDSYPGDRVTVGEVYLLDTARVARYYGTGDELHLAFNFPPLYAPWDAAAWRERLADVRRELDPVDAWPTWVLSNHDNPRHRTRYGSEARARAAAVLLLTLRGTPFLYAGEELGLEDAVLPRGRAVDPGGRDGCRAPIPWDGPPDHGWGTEAPWLPWPPDADTRHVAALWDRPDSILHLYRRLLGVRRASPALRHGTLTERAAPGEVLAYERHHGGDRRLVAVNFAGMPQRFEVGAGWVVDVASDDAGEGSPYAGVLGADTAVLMRPDDPDGAHQAGRDWRGPATA